MKMTKITAIVAAAALLVIGAAFTSMAATYDWQFENGEWVCYNKDGDQYYDTWAQSASGDWYHLGDEGVMDTNKKVQWKSATEKYVYVGADGSIQKDLWIKLVVDEDEGTEKWFRFDSNGYMLKSTKKTIDGKIYFFDANGYMLTGWVDSVASGSQIVTYAEASTYADGKYYCGEADEGAATIGWKQINIADEEEDADIKWFYFTAKGVKVDNQVKKINGKYYSFDEDGIMNSEWVLATAASASAPVASQSYFSSPEDGARVSKGWFRAYAPDATDDQKDEGENIHWYYAKSAGKLAQNEIKKINGKYYCFNDDGQMLSGLVVVKATGSYFEAKELKAEGGLNCDTLTAELKSWTPNADTALYYFSGDGLNDGSMKFGTQKVTFDEEEFTLYFGKSTGENKGKALNTRDDKAIYFNGVKLTADSDLRYGFVAYDAANKTYDNAVVAASTLAGKSKAELAGYKCINTAGRTLTSLSTKDGDDYKIIIKNGVIESIAYAD